MGGEHTEIGDATTTVALEFAWFEPIGIAASVTRTGLRSDASTRWERGVDAYGIDTAIARFVELLRGTCPNLVVHAGAVDARAESLPAESRRTSLRVRQSNRIIGVELTRDDVARLLDPIGFTVSGDDPDALTVELPSWRPDATSEIDVIEEIARHYGYENVPKKVPLSPLHGHLSHAQQRRRLVREVLLGLGISEVMPSPFLSDDDLHRTGLDGAVLRITNPLVADEDVLRPSLRPGLLRAVAYNESHRHPDVALFEIGHSYPPGPGELPDEREMLGVVLAGSEAPAALAVWRELAVALGTGARIDQQRVPAGLHPTRSAALVAGRDSIGCVGEVAPAVLEAYGISGRVAILELDLSVVLAGEPKPPRWKATSRHPSSDLDIAFVLDETIPAEKLEKAIRQGAGNLLVGLELFDAYRGPGVTDGSRSLAYRLRLQAADRTLTDADTAAVVAQVRAAAEKLGATLRRSSVHAVFVSICAPCTTLDSDQTLRGWRLVPGEVVGGFGEPAEAAGLAAQHAAPQLLWIIRENVGGFGVDDDPRPGLDLRLELAGLPAGIAAEDPQGVDPTDHQRRVGGEVRRRDVTGERSEVVGVVVIGLPGGDPVFEAGEGDQRVRLDRPAGEHPRRFRLRRHPTLQGIDELLTAGTVEHEPEGTLVMVLDHVHDRAVEVRVIQQRRGDEQSSPRRSRSR